MSRKPQSPTPGGESSHQPLRLSLAAVAALFLLPFLYLNLFTPLRYLPQTEGDFSNYHRAAVSLSEGGSPYVVGQFDYPALVAYLVLPLAGLEMLQARQFWLAVNWVALIWAAVLIFRLCGRDLAALVGTGLVFCFAGTTQENLVLGQIHPLMLALIAGALVDLDRHPGRSALWIGIATGLKLWPILLLLPHIRARRLRATLIGVAVALILIVVPALSLRPPKIPTTSSYWMGTPAPLSFSLPSVALRFADWPDAGAELPFDWRAGNNPDSLELAPQKRLLSVAVSAAVLVFGAGLLFFRQIEGLRLALALLALAPLASPIGWYHYQMMFAFPALALLGSALIRGRAYRWLPLWVLGGTLMTRSQSLGFGAYVESYGWTAENPFLLGLTTSMVAVLGALLFGLLALVPERCLDLKSYSV